MDPAVWFRGFWSQEAEPSWLNPYRPRLDTSSIRPRHTDGEAPGVTRRLCMRVKYPGIRT